MCAALAIAFLGYVPGPGQVVPVKASQVRSLTIEQRKTARACASELGFRWYVKRRQ